MAVTKPRVRDDGRKVRSAFDASRLNAFSFDPETLVLIEDPKHPLYDARVRIPLKSEFVANIKALGVVEPVIVRKIDGGAVVIDGRQRVRAARQINADAKECLIKVPAMLRTGDEADAYSVTVSLNEQRQDDPVREKMVKAQRLAQLGRSPGDVALAMGVSIATVKRWREAKPKERAEKKGRGKSTRPPAKDVVALIKHDGFKALTDREKTLASWFAGTADRIALLSEFPEFAETRAEENVTRKAVPAEAVGKLTELDLAKIGINALVDEATGYQNVRPTDDLRRMAGIPVLSTTERPQPLNKRLAARKGAKP